MRALAFLVAVATSGCAVGFTASNGTAMVPGTTSAGTTTAISYTEYGGGILHMAFAILGLGSTALRRDYREVTLSSETKCAEWGCWTNKTVRVEPKPMSDAQEAAYERNVREGYEFTKYVVGGGKLPTEIRIDWASTSLGGDTSGIMGSMMFWFFGPGGIPGFVATKVHAGVGLGSYTFHDRTRRRVVSDGMSLRTEEVTEDVDYDYIGLPVRLTGYVTPKLAAHVQFDVNMISVFESDDDGASEPSPVRLGFEYTLSFGLFMKGEVVSDGFDTEALSVGAEVGYALR